MNEFVTSFPRYLAAKKTVDDRALNTQVWQAMAQWIQAWGEERPCRILELGAGIGTMVERLWDAGLLTDADYTAIDNQPENIAAAQKRLAPIASQIPLQLQAIDLFDFIAQQQNLSTAIPYDLIIAHALLDLLDISQALPRILSLMGENGRFYFTINFDGATILQPTIDHSFDAQVEQLYHRTMDERITDGQQSGDSQAGRHLFTQLRQAGAAVLAAGSSDWVVFASPAGYVGDEAYFLHFIVQTMWDSLQDHPQLDPTRFAAWIQQRHQQIESGELVYIAHQLDFWGKQVPPPQPSPGPGEGEN